MKWKVEQLRQLRGYAVECAEPGNFLLSRRNCLFHSTTLEPPFELVAGIDAPFWKRLASNSRLAQRLLRFMVTNVIPLANGEIFVTFDKSVGVVRSGKYCEVKGLFRPCRVLRGACAVDNAGNVFFGEYLANNERGGMRVYKYSPGSSRLESIFTFPSNSIKHIHGIYFDRFTNSLFCLTGDDDKECRITQTFDEFRTLETVGEGDETWRAVSLLFSAESLLYGMDAEFRDNHILQFDRQSREQRSLGQVSGPVYFSKQFSGEMFFTTTAENAPSQKENVAAIWNVDAQGKCEEIAKFRKDRWHRALFMFGTIHFPYTNTVEDGLYFYVVGAKGDGRSYRIRRSETQS